MPSTVLVADFHLSATMNHRYYITHPMNELKDITASSMKEVCHNVTIEPILQPLYGEILHPHSAIVDDNARSDVRAEGFWDCRQQHAWIKSRTRSTFLNPNPKPLT